MASAFDTTLNNLGIRRSNDTTAQVKTASQADSLTANDFIKLLTAQLKNQDPTAPVDSTQQLTQLAQFSQVTGISEMNTTLKAIQEQLSNSSGTTSAADAISYAGRNVLVPGDVAYPRTSGGIAGAIELGDNATAVNVSIQSADGAVLKTIQLGPQTKGTVNFDWDGITDAGTPAGDGPFKVAVSAGDQGKTVSAQPLVWAPVSSVSIPGTGAAKLNLPGLGTVAVTQVREVG